MFIFLVFLLFSFQSEAAVQKVEIEMWTRQPGQYHQAKKPKQNYKKVNISHLTQEALERKDIQYSAVKKYQGIFLRTLINAYNPNPSEVDTVLMHFKNGMVVPIRIDEMPKAPAILIALKIFDKGRWSSRFPDSIRLLGKVKDNRPLQFRGNKVVISEQWAVKSDFKGKKLFTPWKHVDSLIGLEFVSSEAYYRQFRQDSSKDSFQGFLVYLQRCQFCHGAGGVGASYGPDFLNSPSLFQRYNVDDLFKHVKDAKSNLTVANTNMPEQVDVEKPEIRALWFWSKLINKSELPNYAP